MSQTRKIFRIEQVSPANEPVPDGTPAVPAASALDADAALRHLEVITEIRAVRSLVEGRAQEAQRAIDKFHAQFLEFQKIKTELVVIESAITQTKQELATIHVGGFTSADMSRVANELDAVVEGTEQATQAILNAVEEIDQKANALAGSAACEADQTLAREIQDRVVQIFEACNFQDLTGQRITKVVATMKFIEDHIQRMMDIWGGIEAFKEFTPEAIKEREGDEKLLHGPKLEGEPGHASQDDIDALFD
jgi:chemotaxis protein CheZ